MNRIQHLQHVRDESENDLRARIQKIDDRIYEIHIEIAHEANPGYIKLKQQSLRNLESNRTLLVTDLHTLRAG